MKGTSRRIARGGKAFVVAALLAFVSRAALAGPPFQTDDPEPIDFRNYEFYTFASSDGTPLETDTVGPALEFNWGALPNVHLHIIAPMAAIFPAHDARAFGLGDIELGVKLRFVQEGKHRPMIGTFTMFEIPTGNADRGLGVGKTWYKLPIWVQKSFGPWEQRCSITDRRARRRRKRGPRRWWMSAAITSFATLGFSCCSVMATLPLGKPKTTPTLVSTGPGERRKRMPINRAMLAALHSATCLIRGSWVECDDKTPFEGTSLNISNSDVILSEGLYDVADRS